MPEKMMDMGGPKTPEQEKFKNLKIDYRIPEEYQGPEYDDMHIQPYAVLIDEKGNEISIQHDRINESDFKDGKYFFADSYDYDERPIKHNNAVYDEKGNKIFEQNKSTSTISITCPELNRFIACDSEEDPDKRKETIYAIEKNKVVKIAEINGREVPIVHSQNYILSRRYGIGGGKLTLVHESGNQYDVEVPNDVMTRLQSLLRNKFYITPANERL